MSPASPAFAALAPTPFLRATSLATRTALTGGSPAPRPCVAGARPARVSMSALDVTSVSRLSSAGDAPCLRGPQREKKPPAPVPTVKFGDQTMDIYSRLVRSRTISWREGLVVCVRC
jgi:hypothetical protein